MSRIPDRVLVIRMDKVGDLVLATPALRNLRDAWPSAHITALVSPRNAGVLAHSPLIDELTIYDTRWALTRKWRALRLLAARGFDVVLVLSPGIDGLLAAFATRAARRGGVVYSRRLAARVLSRFLIPERTVVRIDEALAAGERVPHEVDQSLDALRALDVPARRAPLEIALDACDRAWVDEWRRTVLDGRPFAALHLSPLWFAEGGDGRDLHRLVEDLIERTRIRSVVVTYGPDDRAAFRRLEDDLTLEEATTAGASVHRTLQGRLLCVGGVPFGRWAALLHASALVITRDTGSLHVAAAGARPIVAVYERRTFALCSQQWAPWMVRHRSLPAAPWPELRDAIVAGAAECVA